jgi:hypothetical protein
MKTNPHQSLHPHREIAVSALALALLSCSGDEARVLEATPDPNAEVPSGGTPSPTDAVEPVYALSYVVWSDEGPTSYVALSHSLEVSDEALRNAREFPGYSTLAAVDGRLLVAEAEEPTITRYTVTDDLGWQDGDTLSFANYGLAEDAAGFYRQYFLNEDTAYAEFDVTKRVVWNPRTLVLEVPMEDSTLALERDGLLLYGNFNRSFFVPGDRVLKPFSYHDEDWFTWSPSTLVAVYDAETNLESAVVDAPCPALDTLSRDEEGNTYLSTWEYSTLHALTGSGAVPCVVRLKPDNTLDSSWNTDLTDLTGGRQIKNFRYVGGGKAVAAVLHDEEYGEGFDFGSYLENIDDFWANEGRYHRLWSFDLDARTAAPVSGAAFDYVYPGFFHARFGDRYFLFLGSGDTNQAAGTAVQELAGDGSATTLFTVPGEALQWVRLR